MRMKDKIIIGVFLIAVAVVTLLFYNIFVKADGDDDCLNPDMADCGPQQ